MRRFPAVRPHARRLVNEQAKGPRVFVSMPRAHSRKRARYHGPSAEWLRHTVLYTLARAAPQVTGDVTVVVTNDQTMRRLNRRFRGKDAPTDVLAFSFGDGLCEQEPFGDVVVSYETARQQARRYSATLRQELGRLIIHGTLHLCGHDHDARERAARMHGLTRRLLREVSGSKKRRTLHA